MCARRLMVAIFAAAACVGLWPGAAALAADMTQGDKKASGYFNSSTTLPGSYRLYIQTGIGGGFWGLGPNRGPVKKASFKADPHSEVFDYSDTRDCKSCHQDEARDMHTVRMGITCRQCHISLPIAGVHQYYSPMNPIRRHAYVCAKCHEGASPSFAGFVIHEPTVFKESTKDSFPLMYYTVWFMLILTGTAFALFLPFTGTLLIREYAARLFGGSKNV